MKYDILNFSIDDYKDFLPDDLLELAKKEELLAYGALEGKKVLGLCLFTDTKTQNAQADIRYIFVRKDHRRKKIGSGLLTNSAAYLKKRGIRAFNARSIGNPKEAMESYKFFLKNRFIPLASHIRVLSYYVRDLSDTKFFEVLMGTPGALKEIIKINDYNDPRLRIFLKTGARDLDFYVEEGDYNADEFGYLLEKDSIAAAIRIKKEADKRAKVLGPYINMAKEKPYAYPSLMAHGFKEVLDTYPEDTTIVFTVDDENLYKVLVSILGPGNSDSLIQVYMKVL